MNCSGSEHASLARHQSVRRRIAGRLRRRVRAPLPMALCAGWRGERVCEMLHEDAQVRVLRCTFPPGVGHEPHYHPPHFGYLLGEGGTMRITTASGVEDRALQAGSHFSNDTEVRHSALNVGRATIRYLIVEKKYADTRAPRR